MKEKSDAPYNDKDKKVHVINKACLPDLYWNDIDGNPAVSVKNYLSYLNSIMDLTNQLNKGHFIEFELYEKLSDIVDEIRKEIKIVAYDHMMEQLDENEEVQQFSLIIKP